MWSVVQSSAVGGWESLGDVTYYTLGLICLSAVQYIFRTNFSSLDWHLERQLLMREVVNVKRWQRMWCCTHAKMKLQSNITGFDHAWILKESHTKSLSILLMSRLNQAAGTNCQNTTESKDLYNKDYKNRDSSVIFISMHIYIWLRVKSKSKSCEDECRLRVKRWIFIFLLHWSNISDSPTLILSLVACYVACSDSQPAYMLVIQYVMMLWSMALFFCLFVFKAREVFICNDVYNNNLQNLRGSDL